MAASQKPHILVRDSAATEPYTYPHEVRGTTPLNIPARPRAEHGQKLLDALDTARNELVRLREQRAAVGVSEDRGMCLEFESDPNFDLAFKSLDRPGSGIELLAVRQRAGKTFATVFIPDGMLGKLEKLVQDYIAKDRDGRPYNEALVCSIGEIRRAALESFWTDEPTEQPRPGETIWWEIWLRAGADATERDAIQRDFEEHAAAAGVDLQIDRLGFLDRTVLLGRGTPEQMATSVELLDCIAELRRAKESPTPITELTPWEQAEHVEQLLERLELPGSDATALCLLDTGVNSGHPLLRDLLVEADLHTVDPNWGVADDYGHGTEMAGLGAYGDLGDHYRTKGPVHVVHRLESVKLLPPPGHPPNEPRLYGALTTQAIARPEISAPSRQRTFCMAISAPDSRDQGAPSSWSAAVDSICFGTEEGSPRLFVVAGGNVPRDEWSHYPDSNDTESIHDPGQSFNALTVGATTTKTEIDQQRFPGKQAVAPAGGLSPSSATSVTWKNVWPIKPDVVMEGGNAVWGGPGSRPIRWTNCHWSRPTRPRSRSCSSPAAIRARRLRRLLGSPRRFKRNTPIFGRSRCGR